MTDDFTANGQEQFRKFVDDFLSGATPGLEGVVDSKAFGEMLGQMAGNFVAMNRLNSDAMDLMLRNLRVAGRADVVSLHRQLARTEDKLEMVLEVVERLEDELAEQRRARTDAATRTDADPQGSGSESPQGSDAESGG